ncbi:hypothetical protein C1645_831972 [Glomus cerebriforme]|uniref:F-box domain-containing protein n=1 Tax=Glomus cerebriforme TaxID=658196 RepID=A0A397S3R6_9GLOM|nr:hypothetical protein C1645_841806 [Glomus cerebriforme]RIA84638.1 hypothetical protein C1645_831972 [Glomus cerebriforme]
MKDINFDCLIQIFNELRKDKKSLHSCLLVNKKWCNVVVSILWKNHAWNIFGLEKKLYNTILSCLPTSSKQFLSNHNIKLPSTIFTKPPLFNYISFCEFPEPEDINGIINMVLGRFSSNDKRIILEKETYKLFINQCKDIKFLTWKTCQPLSLFPGASTCFSQLCNLSIDPDYVDFNALYEMAKICKNLNELAIYNCSQDNTGLISLIDAQNNLEKIYIYHNNNIKFSSKQLNRNVNTCEELSKALIRKSDTINYLHLDLINNISHSFLKSLVNLKRIDIYNKGYADTRNEIKEFQQYLAISEFSNLQFLNIKELSCFKELAMLIGKTKGNLTHFIIDITTDIVTKNTGMLIKAISNNCPKIKTLITYIEPKDFIHVRSLLLNCRYLEDIRFYSLYDVNNNDNIGDELLDILGRFSTNSLTNIIISEDWKYSIDAFERFFKSYSDRTLYSFNIIHRKQFYITENHIAIIRKYVNEGVIKFSNYM